MKPERRTEGAAPRIREGSGGQLQAAAPPAAIPWDKYLVWFMRALALLWIVKGLAAWAVILGAGQPAPSFEARPTGFQATTVYFAVIDPIAGVGLWLTSTWGGVVWLLAVVSYLILAVLFPALLPLNPVAGLAFLLLMIGYLVLSWLGAREP